MTELLKRIVILGGGSAGWLTAALLAADHAQSGADGLQITLIESASQPPIGVGEGTWPTMRDTLRRIGLSETALVRECEATFKQGSRFDGWIRGGEAERYYHPFSLPHGHGEFDVVRAWLAQVGDIPFAERVTAQAHLCGHGLAPKQASTPEFAAVANYGYHFDAGKFGQLLRQHAVQRLGVRHVLDDVFGILSHDNGDIAALQTREHGDIQGDLFVDCSGLPALLLGQHFGVPLRSQRQVLFNDRALALQVPLADPDGPLASQTIATAHASGWTWDIGLPARRGVGLVYSSAHTSEEQATATLLAHVRRTGGPAELPTPRQIRFEPGYREHFWHRNCVAIGLSSGFIEPLEASALALVELSATMLSDELPATRQTMDRVARRFNDSLGYRWSRVIDFLKLHYVLSQRDDNDYWRDHRRQDTIPERLQELLLLWRHRPPYRHDLFHMEEVFSSASYQYVLCGMGWRPEVDPRKVVPHAAAQAQWQETATLTRRMLAALPRHRDLINHIRLRGLPTV